MNWNVRNKTAFDSSQSHYDLSHLCFYVSLLHSFLSEILDEEGLQGDYKFLASNWSQCKIRIKEIIDHSFNKFWVQTMY